MLFEDSEGPHPERDRERPDKVNAQILDIHDLVDWALAMGYLEFANRPPAGDVA
jgi:hypothetical protein